MSYYYDECDFSFVLFSKTSLDSLRTKTQPSYAVCSLLFLKLLKNPTPPNDLYITLVCAEQKSKEEKNDSMGSRLISFAEDFLQQGKMGKIFFKFIRHTNWILNSSKGFAPVKGRDVFEVLTMLDYQFLRRMEHYYTLICPHSLFVNSYGMTTKF